jgi:hypothetical protein
MLSVGQDAAEALFPLVDAAYEKRSLALTSNLHPAGFDELMPKTLATADRRPAPSPRPRAGRPTASRSAWPRQAPGAGCCPLAERASAAPTAAPSPTARPPPGRGGEISWPSVGRTGGLQWGGLVTASEEFLVAVDTRPGPTPATRTTRPGAVSAGLGEQTGRLWSPGGGRRACPAALHDTLSLDR